MNKTMLKEFGKGIIKGIRKNSPTLLTIVGVAGLFGTAFLSGKATLRAAEIVNYNEFLEEEKVGHAVKLSKRKVVKLVWKCYIPTAVTMLTTGAAIVGSNSIHLQRTAAAASVLSLTESTLKEYQAKVIQTIGEKKDQHIKEDIAQDKIDANPISQSTVVATGQGEWLCMDVLSSRYFKHDMEKLRKIQNDINKGILAGQDYASVNDLYYRLGLENTKLGDDMGWNASKLLDFRFTSKVAENGVPCLVIDHNNLPFHTFRN